MSNENDKDIAGGIVCQINKERKGHCMGDCAGDACADWLARQEDMPIPWSLITAIFIGGSTRFKLSQSAVDIIRTAQAMDKWVHVGRVNDPKRWERCEKLGVNSVDGTGIARYSHMRLAIRDRHLCPQLKLEAVA